MAPRWQLPSWLVVLVWGFGASAASAQTFNTMINNGPSANRVDIVFLGDGYTAADHSAGTYVNHITGYINYMFTPGALVDPFPRYNKFFNVHRVNVVSAQSGADQPQNGIFRNTALDASYRWDGVTDRLLYISESKANAALATGLAGTGVTAEMKYVVVNDSLYGGGGGNYAVYAGANSASHEIALHEVGHSFARLADEYGGFPGPYSGAEPTEVNVTKDPTGDKWSRWHGYNQPGIGIIGSYEGARYYDTGLFRPSDNSKMRSLNRPFDAVSREKFNLDIYELVDPLDSWTPNGNTLTNPGSLAVVRIDVMSLRWSGSWMASPSTGRTAVPLTSAAWPRVSTPSWPAPSIRWASTPTMAGSA
jgi:hypothetical protein